MEKTGRLPLVLILLVFSCFGCRAEEPDTLIISKDRSSYKLVHNGYNRTGIIYVPESYSEDKQYSLVFGLHGRGSNAEGFQNYRFNEIADHHDFIMVYPNGMYGEWDVLPGRETRSDDVAVFKLLIKQIQEEFSIDPERIYFSGHSMGGYMVYRLAYELSDMITAIAPVAGQVLGVQPGIDTPPDPVSVLHIHAIDDPVVPFGGDPASYSLSAVQSVTVWRGLSGCLEESTPIINKPSIRSVVWGGDDPDVEVGIVLFESGGHSWMQHTTELIADFFYNHPRRENVIRIDTSEMKDFYETGNTITIPTLTDHPELIKKISLLVNGKEISETDKEPFSLSWVPETPVKGRISLTAKLKNGVIVKSSNTENVFVTRKNITGKAMASTSSIQDGSLTPDMAIDGKYSSRWSSGWNDPQWLKIEYAEPKTIDGITLVWEAAYAKAYAIEVSDNGKDWKQIYKQNKGTGGTEFISFDPVKTRMIRMHGTERGTRWGYSLWEMIVHGN